MRVQDKYYIECKSFKKWPKWLEDVWAQANTHCKTGKVPVVQIHKAGTHHMTGDIIILPISEFKRLLETKDV